MANAISKAKDLLKSLGNQAKTSILTNIPGTPQFGNAVNQLGNVANSAVNKLSQPINLPGVLKPVSSFYQQNNQQRTQQVNQFVDRIMPQNKVSNVLSGGFTAAVPAAAKFVGNTLFSQQSEPSIKVPTLANGKPKPFSQWTPQEQKTATDYGINVAAGVVGGMENVGKKKLLTQATKGVGGTEGLYDQPVYHGSPIPLKKFSNKKGGVFFTSSMENASGFAGSPDNVYEGYLNFKKPLIIDAKGAKWNELKTKYGTTTQEVISNAQKEGYDGVTFKNIVDNVMDTEGVGSTDTIHYAFKPEDAFLNEPLPKVAQQPLPSPQGVGGVPEGGVRATAAGSGLQSTGQRPQTPALPGQLATEGLSGTSGGSIPPVDPVQKIIDLLKEAKPMRDVQETLYSAERSKRAGAVAGIGANVPGEKGFYAQLGALKGELPKVQFSRIRNGLQQPEIDSLFNKVEQTGMLSPFEKVTAKTALSKLLGAEGGQIPTNSELKLLGDVFPQEMVQAILDKRPMIQKLFSLGVNALNVPRAIMATADLSAPLRQGIFLIGRPKEWLPAFGSMFKYAGSEKAYQGLMDDIASRPTYSLMREHKLALTDMTKQALQSREEAFMSTLPEKLPIFGRLVKGSERAYSGFLNKLRADTFDSMYKSASEQGLTSQNPKLVSDIANFVNTATGRGNLGKFQKAAEILNATLFAPRLVASRVNLLNPGYYVSLDPFVRKEALKSLFGFVGTGATVLGLAKLGGAEVGTDPRSSDFGKIKIGNTRYDIWGGFQQYIKLASQLATGQIVSSTTGKTMTLGEGYKPMTRKDILLRFFESKESPVMSFITSLLTGQNGVGDPVNIPSEVISRFIPLIAQDYADLSEEYGPVKGALMAIPGLFGIGSQTYGKQEVVKGKNTIGEPITQVQPVKDLPTRISDKLFGPQPLGNSSTWSVQAYYNQLKKLPKQEAAQKFDELAKSNPDLAKKLVQVIKDEQKGITVDDQTLKAKGVADGTRAKEIAKQFSKLKTNQEKAKLWNDYVAKGIITKDVADQLATILKGGK